MKHQFLNHFFIFSIFWHYASWPTLPTPLVIFVIVGLWVTRILLFHQQKKASNRPQFHRPRFKRPLFHHPLFVTQQFFRVFPHNRFALFTGSRRSPYHSRPACVWTEWWFDAVFGGRYGGLTSRTRPYHDKILYSVIKDDSMSCNLLL